MIIATSCDMVALDISAMYNMVLDNGRVDIYLQFDNDKLFLGTAETVKELTYILYINKSSMSYIQKTNYITKIIKNIEILELATDMQHIDGLIDYVFELQTEVEGIIIKEVRKDG